MSALDVRDDVLELARLYEEVAALDVVPEPGQGVRAVPGSRVPPGMQEILDDDELRTTLAKVEDDALSWVHMVLDEHAAPDGTPGRLRYVAARVAAIVESDDELFALAFLDDLAAHMRSLRRLARRGARLVRTGARCQLVTCAGHLVSPLGRPGATESERRDDALVCDRCGATVPYSVWSSWPRARVQWVTVEHAAKIAGTTVAGVKMRASRGRWRRVGSGRDVRYFVDDVRGDGDTQALAAVRSRDDARPGR